MKRVESETVGLRTECEKIRAEIRTLAELRARLRRTTLERDRILTFSTVSQPDLRRMSPILAVGERVSVVSEIMGCVERVLAEGAENTQEYLVFP